VLTSFFGVVILLGGLIFFHELGHYLVAKFFHVKVETFSLGFGKKIFKKKWGETEYCLSLIPLGGYVKLMGDDPYKPVPPEDAARAFSTQALYKRFAVVAAGPIANLLLAYVLFILVFSLGQPQVSSRIGSVITHSSAWKAGLRSGDKIIAAGNDPIVTWQDIETWARTREGQVAELTVERGPNQIKLAVPVTRVSATNPYGEEELVGGIKGMSPNPVAASIGISDPESAAYRSGLRTGDFVKKVGNQEISTFDELSKELGQQWKSGAKVEVAYQRFLEGQKKPQEGVAELLFPKERSENLDVAVGLYPSEMFVRQVSKDSPAEKGGLLKGDRIVQIGDDVLQHFDTVVDTVQDLGSKGVAVNLMIERSGKKMNLALKPIETTQEDPITHQTFKKYMIGFAPYLVYKEPEYTSVKVSGFGNLVTRAVGETNELARKMVVSIAKLATGSISLKNLGGPVLIATVAGKSLDAGIVQFLQMMALISINLFLLNLFPVPILDGGHLLFFTIEAIKGKPVTIRTMEIANQIGMVFILTLVVLTLFNDISRIILH